MSQSVIEPRHRTIRGQILYTSRKPGMMNAIRGREHFSWTLHEDGCRTLTAHCELNEPEPQVVRDVIYSIDRNNRPLDVMLRLTVGGKFMGAGLFRMDGNIIECESYGPGIGRLSQVLDTGGDYAWFGTHPLAADGYNTVNFDRTQGPIKRRMRSFLSSLDHRGASDPMINGHHIFLEYVGDETITVPAGTFDCRHFRFLGEADDPIGHPPYDLWVSADDDNLFVRGQCEGKMMTYYELVELER